MNISLRMRKHVIVKRSELCKTAVRILKNSLTTFAKEQETIENEGFQDKKRSKGYH